jgi:nitroimidazol reductase NimA-like FMN-containing flavoprotein (pyridoxamine 5'-phosphate oxidase superfamily)
VPVSPTPVGRLKELTPDQCWELAATSAVGRLAWQGPHAPTVVPVNFAIDGSTVRIRTTAYSEAGQQCDDSMVAFQVDTIDPEGRTGWSVLMRGRAHAEYTPSEGSSDPDTWVSGPRTLNLRVDVEEISGRVLA